LNQNKIETYSKENFKKVLNELGVYNPEQLSYVVCPTSKDENYNNLDDIFKIWVTPSFSGIVEYIQHIS